MTLSEVHSEATGGPFRNLLI